jgi:hypothetical protein
MAGAAKAAAELGAHAELSWLVLKAMMARDMHAAAEALAILANQPVAAEVLGELQASKNMVRELEGRVRELEARGPELQHLLVGIAGSHQQLQAAAADITASVVNAAMQAAGQATGRAAGAAAAAAASAAVVAAVADVAPIVQDTAATAAAAAMAAASAQIAAERPHKRRCSSGG